MWHKCRLREGKEEMEGVREKGTERETVGEREGRRKWRDGSTHVLSGFSSCWIRVPPI